MTKYIIKRIFSSIITIFAVVTITFFLMRLMPGGPFDSEKMTPEIKANLNEKYGLDKPLGEQYVNYLGNLVQGDLGESMVFPGREVKDTISYSFPTSARLGLVSVVVSMLVGIGLGIISALNIGKWPDRLCVFLATLGITIPSFVVGSVLILVLSTKLGLLSPTGFYDWKSYIMPVIALSGSSMAFITRLTRGRMSDVMKSDYIRTAKAKGLSNRTVIVKHALRNSLIPIITYLGTLVAGVMTGSFVVERIFAIPGLGNEFVLSVTNRDYSMLLGVTVFYCVLLIVCNLIVDILYGVVDPRIKLEGGKS